MSYEQIIQTKPVSSYTSQDVNEIKAISFDQDNFALKGSFSFRGSKYPSDIDVSDVFTSCCDRTGAIKKFIKKLQEIVAGTQRANHWFLELKAGTDVRYLTNNINLPFFELLHNNKLITDDEFELAYHVLSEDGSLEELQELLRQYATVRWTADEVLSGYKLLHGGVGVSLQDAIDHSEVINIELIVVINNRFTEMSNFFYLLYYSPDGSIHTINTPQESYTNFPDFFGKELRKNITKLYYSELQRNYLKLAKRYFTYGRFFNDRQLVEAVYPLLNSNISLAGQLKSELATIEKLIESVSFASIPLSVLRDHLDSIKARLANIIEIPDDMLIALNNYLLMVINTRLLTSKLVLTAIKPVKKYLTKFVDDYAHRYLESVHLVPPPQELIY